MAPAVVHLLDTRTIADVYPSRCGAPILDVVEDDGDWDSAESIWDVSCQDCTDLFYEDHAEDEVAEPSRAEWTRLR